MHVIHVFYRFYLSDAIGAILLDRWTLCWHIEINVLIYQIGYMTVKRSGLHYPSKGPSIIRSYLTHKILNGLGSLSIQVEQVNLQASVMYNRKDLILQIEKDDNSYFLGLCNFLSAGLVLLSSRDSSPAKFSLMNIPNPIMAATCMNIFTCGSTPGREVMNMLRC